MKIRYKRPWMYAKQFEAVFNDAPLACTEATTKCFTKGTPVVTSSGLKPIEEIQIGERVLCWANGGPAYRPVLKRFDNHGVWDAIRIDTTFGPIVCSQDHKFRTDSGWIEALELARRAMAYKRYLRTSVLHQRLGENGVTEIPRSCGQNRNHPAWARREGVHENHDPARWGVSDGESSSVGGRNVDWYNSPGDDGAPSQLQPVGQSRRESGDNYLEAEYPAFGTRRAVRQINRKHQWKLKTDGRRGGCYPASDLRWSDAKNTSEGIRGEQEYDCKSGKRLEARCLNPDEIIGFELFRFQGTFYDLSVEGAHNYAITKEAISVHNSGKTISCIAWLVEQALFQKRGRNVWWVAPTFVQAQIAFRRAKNGLPKAIYKANQSALTITLINGVTIWFKSGEKPDGLFGEDVWACVIDEASRCRAEAFHAVRSTLTATRGPLRLIGNLKGRKNWFYNLCRKAESGEPGMHYSKLTAHDAIEAGIISADEVEAARRQLPEAVFKELYLAEPSDDGGNPFGLTAIERCVIGEMSNGEPVAWGVDLAKSVDWTVAIALDEESRVCRFERWQASWQHTEDLLVELIGGVPGFVDSTGVGDPILEKLVNRGLLVEGYKFTGPSKQQLMEGLAMDIHQQAVRYPDGILRNELDTFEYEFTRTGVRYSAPSGLHDDCVCALALARSRVRQGMGGMLAAYG